MKEKMSMPQNLRRIKALKVYSVLGVVTVIMLSALFIIIIPIYKNAESIGGQMGETLGNVVGYATGSYLGITKELPRGWEDGKAEGLSAEDTIISLGTGIEQTEKLEILRAGVRLDDYLEIAKDYKALYIYKANAIFSIDLSTMQYREGEQENQIIIQLKQPGVELYIDDAATAKIAEWQKSFYSGKTEDGYLAYINSMAKIKEKTPEEVANYEALMEQARDSARKQIVTLARAAGNKEVIIEFID